MSKAKKEFNSKLYAIVAFVVVGALLATVTVCAYKSKYNAFSPEKTAVAFTQSIVETGDGYNAYKNTVMSVNYKYGDYIRENYMYPVIYAENGYKAGDDTSSLKGLNDESYMSEKSLNDDGSLAGSVIDSMYPYYTELIKELGGWDNYDAFFTKYFAKLCEVREGVFGDKYMTDEIMFTALESNVEKYGKSLTGTKDVYDSNTGVQTEFKSIGKYQEKFGDGYSFGYKAVKTENIDDLETYRNSLDKNKLDSYKISLGDIKNAVVCEVEISVGGKTVSTQSVTLMQIGSSWYVDNITTDTKALY